MRWLKWKTKILWSRVLKALGKEDCFRCGWGVAGHQNEITLRGHIGVIGHRCNRCQHKYDVSVFKAQLM